MKRASLAFLLCMVCLTAFAQKTVHGTVKDASGEPMMGVTISVDGKNATITDLDGNFTLQNVNPSSVVSVSYVGYLKKSVTVGNSSTINIVLESDSQNLDELVVVGYGVMKKRDLTGSVSSVKAADIENTVSSNALQAVQAKIPGLDLTQSSGQAGGSVSMTLRGTRSILADNDPLVLVDGVEYGSTIDLNSSDIESIEVLKDASSTAIYGSRGANGVIIITTKRGQAGKTHVSFNAFNSFNSPTNVPTSMYGMDEVQRLLDKADYATNYATYEETGTWGTSQATIEEITAGYTLDDGTETYDIIQDGSFTNWGDLLLKNSTSQNYEVSVNGGNEVTNFNISLGANYDRGLMEGDKVTRYNGKVNIDHKINKLFKVGASLLFNYKSNGMRNSGVFSQSLKMTSITHAYLSDGTINTTPNPWYASHSNPLLDFVDGRYQRNRETTRFFGNAYMEVTPLDGLSYRSMFSVNRQDVRLGLYQDYQSTSRYQSPSTNYISNQRYANTNITWDNTINYIKSFGKHSLNALLGHELIQDVNEGMKVAGDAGTTHYYQSSFYDMGNSKISSPTVTPAYTKTSLLSFFGRLNYNYAEKYLATLSLRADGASQLAEGNKWDYFPSAAVGWRVIEEPFMESTKGWLDNLKLRVSWGISGNASVDAYSSQATLSSTVYYYFGGDVAGKIPNTIANPDLKWEKTSQIDIGIDFGILNGRLSGTVDYYRSKTDDLLFYSSAPASSVFTSVISNVGKTEGSGLEVALNARPVVAGGFTWDINATYSHINDKVTELTEDVDKYEDGRTAIIVGERVNTYLYYETTGTWNIGEFDEYLTANGLENNYPTGYGEPGTLKITDIDMDGDIDSDDRIIYNKDPNHLFGLTNTFIYKDVSLSVQLMGRLGGYIEYSMNNQLTYDTANWGGGTTDYWTPTNTDAKFPSPGASQTIYSTYGAALLYEKGDFVKIKDITLAYNLPKTIISKIGLTRARIYGSLKNFFCFSSIDNFDPEAGGGYSFPLAKQAVIGINLDF